MRPLHLTRRSLLQGLGGAALALPVLEIMGEGARAQATGIPKRFLTCFGGISTGREGVSPASTDLFTPDVVGADYDVKTATAPLEELGVKGRVSIVSNLQTPWGEAAALPPGGRVAAFHSFCYGPLFCGVRTANMTQVNGPSADQIVGAAIGADTKVPVMVYRVQAAAYGDSRNVTMSYRQSEGGPVQPITPKVSPQLIFNELFEGFVPAGADAEALAAAQLLRDRRLSVLDLVARKTERLRDRLGAADRLRLDQHLEAVRDLEQRIANLSAGGGGAGCALPDDPGADPTVGATYGDEKARGEIIVDLIHMAFACDLSRAGSLQITMPQCSMNMLSLIGVDKSLHDIGHSSDDGVPGSRLEQLSQGIAWHVGLFARLVDKLASTIEIDGSSVLDHTAMVMLFEGGHGFDPQTGDDHRTHSSENMVGLVAGGAGGLAQGVHVASNLLHPVALTATAMQAVDVPGGLGEVTQTVPELLG